MRASIEREYEDLVAVIEAIGEPVTLVGHSYGGVVSLGAARLTDLVERLVLYEPSIQAQDATDCDSWADRIQAHVDARDPSAAALAFFEMASSPGEIAKLRASEPAWRQIERDAHTIPRAAGAEADGDRPVRRRRPAGPAARRRAQRPYLRDGVARLAAKLPSSRTVEIEGQGHLAQAYAPERVCAEILRFAQP